MSRRARRDSAGDPVEAGRRSRVRRAGAAGLVVLVAVPAYLAVLGTSTAMGEHAWGEERYADAERWFRVADRIDVVERWKAPYDLGVAVFSQGRWAEAADLFGRARASAPDHALCRVALNEALSLEVLGDELDAAGDATGARARWTQAQQVLSEAEGCSASGPDEDDAAEEESPAEDAASGSDSSEDGGQEDDRGEDGQDNDGEGSEGEGEGGEGDGQDGQDGSGEAAEAAGDDPASEAEQLQQASERLREKVSGSPTRDHPADGDPAEEDKAAELQERMSGAARRRAGQQDASAPASGGGGDRPTW